MGQAAESEEKKKSTAQERRDAHYSEQGVTAKHAKEGAQYKAPSSGDSEQKDGD